MRLSSLSLHGFKCFAQVQQLPLRPLTLIFGRNNSGKSTILQSLLLLKQSVEAPELGPRLNTRGFLYPGGAFVDLVHGHTKKSSASFEFGLSTADPQSSFRFQFRRDVRTGASRIQELEVVRSGVDELVVKRGAGKGGPYELRIGQRQLGVERRGNFVIGEARFFPLIGEEPPRVGKPNQRNMKARQTARDSLRALEQVLIATRAIGAFRRAPERRYEFEGREPVGADPAGEKVAHVIIADVRKRKSPGTLVREINRWLRELAGVWIEVVPVAERIRLFELRVRGRGTGADNLADVGFGIGQALPVLVEGLRTPPGGVFIVQEPEIHLHPDAQLAMADFLVHLVCTGRQVIAETHSESLLLRIRRRIAEKNGQVLERDQVSFLVVERSSQGRSTVRTILADELGRLKGWPVGFMEDASAERLKLLSAIASDRG